MMKEANPKGDTLSRENKSVCMKKPFFGKNDKQPFGLCAKQAHCLQEGEYTKQQLCVANNAKCAGAPCFQQNFGWLPGGCLHLFSV